MDTIVAILIVVLVAKLCAFIIAVCSLYRGRSIPENVWLVLVKLVGDALRVIWSEIRGLINGLGDKEDQIMLLINLGTLLLIGIFGITMGLASFVASPFGGQPSLWAGIVIGFLTLVSILIVALMCMDKVAGS